MSSDKKKWLNQNDRLKFCGFYALFLLLDFGVTYFEGEPYKVDPVRIALIAVVCLLLVWVDALKREVESLSSKADCQIKKPDTPKDSKQ